MNWVLRCLERYLYEPWLAIDAEWRRELTDGGAAPAAPTGAAPGRGRQRRAPAATAAGGTAAPAAFDWRPLVVLTTVAVALSIQEYWGDRGKFRELFPEQPGDAYWLLKSYVWWSGWRFFGYVVLPVLAIWLLPGERLRDYHISLRGFRRHLWIYAVLFLLILPLVVIVSRSPAFHHTYPFYKLANRSVFDFVAWELLYALQFLSLEFFFRGFMLRGLRARFGSGAIFVMVVPYCMIHFGKPMPETLGAIVAGIVLGTLAMRTRSIWGGVVIHVAVALTMDLLALGYCPPAESGLPCDGH